jgi:acyl-CoA dehydrogenase
MSQANDWVAIVRALGPTFAERAAQHDADDSFVAANYAELKQKGVFAAGVPAELGGGGASPAELSAMLRELAHHCSSTALALSMHTHPVATMAYSWRGGNKQPEGLLRRVASDGVVLVTSGGSDWLAGSGKLEKVEGGFKLTGRKIFGSGVPAASVLMTMGILDDPETGPTVVHVPVPMNSPGLTVLDTWRVLGMRGTGSHDIQLDGVFIPEAAAGLRRPPGKWHPFFHTVTMMAMPLVYSVYLGVAEAARDAALQAAKRRLQRSADPATPYLVGELENALITAQLAVDSLVAIAASAKPGPETTSAALARRTIAGKAMLATLDKALEVAGGGSFFRNQPLERLFRDIQASRFHPMSEKAQTRLTGQVLLGQELD